jgi:hypothetical protein
MVAEKRAAKAVGRDADPIPDPGFGGNTLFPGGTAYDAGRAAEIGYHEQKFPRATARPDAGEATKVSRDLLKGAGFNPAELDRVEPLLKQSDRGEKIRKQMTGPKVLPKWEK